MRSLKLMKGLICFLMFILGIVIAWSFVNRSFAEPRGYAPTPPPIFRTNENDTSPHTPEELLKDIIENHFQTTNIDSYFDQVNQEIFDGVVNNLKQIDIPFLKAIWHSRGRIVLTNGSLTNLESLASLRGQETCHDALHTCRSFDDINGLHRHNRAYKRIRPCEPTGNREFNNIEEVRTFCNVQSRIYLNSATLFHEIGHLLDQSIALIEQFGEISLRRISDQESFQMIVEAEFDDLFRGLPGLTRYFSASWEYAAESFAMFYGFSSTHQLRNQNILLERAPRTYSHFRYMLLNYDPRPTERY